MPLVDASMVTSALELPGYRIVRNFGIVRGIVVRSRSIIGNLGAALQTIVGGNITLLTNLCEKTREDAFELLLQHAAQHGDRKSTRLNSSHLGISYAVFCLKK